MKNFLITYAQRPVAGVTGVPAPITVIAGEVPSVCVRRGILRTRPVETGD